MIQEKTSVSLSFAFTARGKDVCLPSGINSVSGVCDGQTNAAPDGMALTRELIALVARENRNLWRLYIRSGSSVRRRLSAISDMNLKARTWTSVSGLSAASTKPVGPPITALR